MIIVVQSELPVDPSPVSRLDVNGDGLITARDALNVINNLGGANLGGTGEQPIPGLSRFDVNQDGKISAADALMVINRLSGSSDQTSECEQFVQPPKDEAKPLSTESAVADSISLADANGKLPSFIVNHAVDHVIREIPFLNSESAGLDWSAVDAAIDDMTDDLL